MAYAAVASLITVVEQMFHHPRIGQHIQISNLNEHLKTLQEKLNFLHDFLDDTSFKRSEQVECLERKIRDAAYAAEDILDFHLLKESDVSGGDQACMMFRQNIEKIIEEMNSMKKEMMEIKDGSVLQDLHLEIPSDPGSSRNFSIDNIPTVGIDDELLKLKEELTGDHSGIQIISLVGMGGIGKTTLAQKGFNDPFIRHHFDVRAWVTVSQTYSVEKILENLLDSMNCKIEGASEENLKEHLYKTLKNMRYFVVMDDVWDTVIWDSLNLFFPDDSMGSRIMLTTRLESVAIYANSYMPLHHMGLLSMDVSWDLFCTKVFREESCPDELEELGKKIVRSCCGLPLAIAVIGGVLSNFEKTKYCWENVSEDVFLDASTKMEQCSNVLSKSYKYLPNRLKACLLYMGAFPEDDEISVSTLIKLWVSEGFLRTDRSKSLEEVAERNLEELVERSLIFVRKKKSNGKMKTCGIHDLLRDFCLSEAENEKFFHATDLYGYNIPKGMDLYRRIGFRSYENFDSIQPNSPARSVFVEGHASLDHILLSSEQLRVLHDDSFTSHKLMFYVNIRFLRCHLKVDSKSSFFKNLWNIQTFISEGSLSWHPPFPIWNVSQLRHFKCMEGFLLSEVDEERYEILENLQTLLTVLYFKCTEQVWRRIPNVKKLGIDYRHVPGDADWSYYCLNNIIHLQKLETLRCESLWADNILGVISFPPSLRNLTLRLCKLLWEDMTIVGSLPNLEVLKIMNTFDDEIWEPIEGEFCRLKFLLLHGAKLKYLMADSTHFPCLENLQIWNCDFLEEIPCGVGDIPTLETIDISYGKISLFNSAQKIAEEQRSNGNEGFQVRYQETGRSLVKIL